MRVRIVHPEIALLESIKKFDKIDMKTIDNLPPIRCASIKIPRKGRGEDVKLPIWLAEYLIDRGKVNISEKALKILSQNLWRELAQPSTGSTLAKIDTRFYTIAHTYMYILKRGGIIGTRPMANRDNIRAVINKRREVISKLSHIDLGVMEDRLTLEEKILLSKLRVVNKDWEKAIGVD
jgi:hypothetical protein